MELKKSLWHAEEGWLIGENPWLLLEILTERKVKSSRKYRLAACACCQAERRDLEERQRTVLDLSEQYADGLIDYEELRRAAGRCTDANSPRPSAKGAARQTGHRQGRAALYGALENLLGIRWSWPEAASASPLDVKARAYARIIRDVFGNPFRPVSLKAYRTPDVVMLAEGIYQEKDWGRMGVLADALEDAGCAEPAVLDHCRSGEEHVRGCWVIDGILGKE